ncbi:putative thaumatin [Medicago truncatula]|uniref:Putative thaumatin n=1 Tax=Medicago truncatula TaxID=3880 RepID=A0A396HV36_MEDTR|nr:pathogenesis-related thaumatin-like protein 3.5 [Medicago truncatula]RHN56373.1 putative thaumatin [Medicago truncatula]
MPRVVPWKLLSFIFFVFTLLSFSFSTIFTITNNCPYTIWPGTLAGAGTSALPSTGFQLDSGQAAKLTSVPGWSGRIWARTGCTFDASGIGKCQTGDCGGRLECDGNGAAPPTSLFEITIGQGDQQDYYDVSMVDGYNLPMLVLPRGVYGKSACNATGCVTDINRGCPKELQVVGGDGFQGSVIGCKSACEAFGSDQYCCSGQYANPTTCQPSFYSTIFKKACPRAYSYAFDDGTSTFTCKAYEYDIVFCPTSNKINKPNDAFPPPPPPPLSIGFPYEKVQQDSSSSSIILPFQVTIFLLVATISMLVPKTWALI